MSLSVQAPFRHLTNKLRKNKPLKRHLSPHTNNKKFHQLQQRNQQTLKWRKESPAQIVALQKHKKPVAHHPNKEISLRNLVKGQKEINMLLLSSQQAGFTRCQSTMGGARSASASAAAKSSPICFLNRWKHTNLALRRLATTKWRRRNSCWRKRCLIVDGLPRSWTV